MKETFVALIWQADLDVNRTENNHLRLFEREVEKQFKPQDG